MLDTPLHPDDLRKIFAGEVFAAGDEGWDDARQGFNLAIDQRPALVAIPRDAPDVAAAVRFAAERGLRVAPQTTGHNNRPLDDLSGSILLKTSAMRRFEIDPKGRTARAEAGVKWGPLADEASGHRLAPLFGSARDVGVVGYSLGGGMGWLARKHGLQCNAVTAIEVVTADGRQLRVDQEHEPDLFWAMRGGGGSFGVVTAIEFDLFPLEQIYAGSLFFPFERSSEIVQAWRQWAVDVPDDVGTTVKVVHFPDIPEFTELVRGNSFVIASAAIFGSEAFGRDVLAEMRALGPAMDTFAMVEPAALSYLAMEPEEPLPHHGDGRLYDMPAEGFDRFVADTGPGSGSALVVAEIRLTGGALARSDDRHGATDTLPGNYVTYLASLTTTPDEELASFERVDRIKRSLKEYQVGSYRNFAEDNPGAEDFNGKERAARLRALREKWDPQRVIHANHVL